MSAPGHVFLVGAGPGDPDLLTRKAVRALRQADLVLYDALVDERVLKLVRRAAHRFYVGKRATRHALSQEEIHALLISHARRGRRVVRLKGGDPFVFGRGGEEAQALANAGIPYDIVPGITSVVAAPAAAGIPLTHRDLASAFFVVSGHDDAVFTNAVSALRPNGITFVVLMGYARRAQLASCLLETGWQGSTPVAIIADGTRATQQTWRGTLAEVSAGSASIETDGPALIVVGAVAALALTGGVPAVPVAANVMAAAERTVRTRAARIAH
jgi:uroporphyrin-III C-methyltransferase/precorrin-2 dehydrogenase/sirohydrochlorin ferrochelatase